MLHNSWRKLHWIDCRHRSFDGRSFRCGYVLLWNQMHLILMSFAAIGISEFGCKQVHSLILMKAYSYYCHYVSLSCPFTGSFICILRPYSINTERFIEGLRERVPLTPCISSCRINWFSRPGMVDRLPCIRAPFGYSHICHYGVFPSSQPASDCSVIEHLCHQRAWYWWSVISEIPW